jgi:hypothetical protein
VSTQQISYILESLFIPASCRDDGMAIDWYDVSLYELELVYNVYYRESDTPVWSDTLQTEASDSVSRIQPALEPANTSQTNGDHTSVNYNSSTSSNVQAAMPNSLAVTTRSQKRKRSLSLQHVTPLQTSDTQIHLPPQATASVIPSEQPGKAVDSLDSPATRGGSSADMIANATAMADPPSPNLENASDELYAESIEYVRK